MTSYVYKNEMYVTVLSFVLSKQLGSNGAGFFL